MADLVLTPAQIKSKLDTDASFALQFVVENQPNIVVDRLKQNGLTKIDTPEKAYNYLNALISVDPEKVKNILNNIPYDPAAPNWTGTMDDYFPKIQTKAGGFWSGILAGISAITGAVSGVVSSSGTPLTAEQIEAARKEEERRQEELKKAQQRKYLVVGLIIIAVLIIGVVWYNSGKTTESK